MQPMNFSNFFSSINTKEVLTNLPDAVLVIEEDGLISWVNDRAIYTFETSRDDILGLHLDDIVVDGMHLAEKSHVKKSSFVTGAITPSSKEFFVELNARKYGMQFFVTLRNTTHMTSVLSQAENTSKVNREKNIMLTQLASDFKSPMQSIIGFSQALLDNIDDPLTEKQSKYVQIINKNSKDLLNFMEKFLDFSYVESSTFKVKRKLFDVLTLFQSICKDNELLFQNKKLTLVLDNEYLQRKTVYMDEDALRKVIQQILELAVNLTEIGTITIRIFNPDIDEVKHSDVYWYVDAISTDYLKIQIKDTGMGFSSTEMKNIYNPYAIMDSSNKKAILHAIIMNTVKNIVNRLGGCIQIDTEVMKGTVFNIVLPVEKDKEIENE
ncbi:MAG: PAS domain-containing sensor histidine kinase [Clostridiaceae bacterium]|jgi:signal transduction histidine kinase|nr:PAS domain-containing sensor histidine kinase [Clostridiaceae bacterium]